MGTLIQFTGGTPTPILVRTTAEKEEDWQDYTAEEVTLWGGTSMEREFPIRPWEGETDAFQYKLVDTRTTIPKGTLLAVESIAMSTARIWRDPKTGEVVAFTHSRKGRIPCNGWADNYYEMDPDTPEGEAYDGPDLILTPQCAAKAGWEPAGSTVEYDEPCQCGQLPD
jgi:hypothetical protein